MEATTLAQLPNAANIRVLGCDSWDDFDSAISKLARTPKSETFDTIVVDNISPAYSMCVDWTVSQQNRPVISEATWTRANATMMATLDKLFLTNKDKNVILVAHSRRDKDSEGNVVRIFPDFGESLARKIVGRVTALFYYRMQGQNRVLATSAVPGIDVGSRYDLPKSLTNPTSAEIIDLINKYKQRIQDQNKPQSNQN